MNQRVDEICQRIQHGRAPIAVRGAVTKDALVPQAIEADWIDLDALPAGIISYDPSEFLITAWSGTTMSELCQATAEHGQWLPFDPLFVDFGATLGGTIAAGLSGPRQLLLGRLRDFVMEVECVDGLGKLVRGGGKVVKNAAGFDLPKFLVGSYGRLGVLTQATLKILPRPPASCTVTVAGLSAEDGLRAVQRIAGQPLPLAATCWTPSGRLDIQFAAPAASLPRVVRRIVEWLPGAVQQEDGDEARWDCSARWMQTLAGHRLWRAVHSSDAFPRLLAAAADAGIECQAAWAAFTESWWCQADDGGLARWHACCLRHGASAVQIRGPADHLNMVGHLPWLPLVNRLRAAIDPRRRFFDLQPPVEVSPREATSAQD
ncbi:MAG: hypothetical protein KatS3mg111_3531 [Pirellulaceae bacterium]|nr:MAG: hypothetical protein KatS3mg111_3531 [Pirellulaceae bacterium]